MTSKTDSSTPETTGRAWQQVEAQLHAFYNAWQVRNASDIRKLFTDDDRLLLWGTDRWERIKGRAEADREPGSGKKNLRSAPDEERNRSDRGR